MAFLYIVATPIGNIKDISIRALEVLKKVDLILCEDTRVTRKLLDYYQIKTPTLSYHQHSKIKKVDYIINLLKEEKNLALVSDAGTPGISDPGNLLIKEILNQLKEKVKIVPLPGPNAAIAALSISGFPSNKFLFLGFPPVKKKREKFFEQIVLAKCPVVFYESSHRIIKTLRELNLLIPYRQLIVCRELTKKFETVYRGNIEEIIKELENDKNNLKGEFTIIVSK